MSKHVLISNFEIRPGRKGFKKIAFMSKHVLIRPPINSPLFGGGRPPINSTLLVGATWGSPPDKWFPPFAGASLVPLANKTANFPTDHRVD